MIERSPLRAAVRRTLRWRAARPDFLVIGAQKAATTSVHAYLSAHPGVRLPPVKEIEYFSDHHAEGRDWYLDHFPLAPPGRRWLTGEASPDYLFHPAVPARVAAELPRTKVIAIVRNPVDRAYSQWSMQIERGWETASFEEALAIEADGLSAELTALRADPARSTWWSHHFSYAARGRYLEQLQAWAEHVPPERTLVLVTEQLAADPAGQLARIHDFLGLPAPGEELPRVLVGRYDAMSPATRVRLEAEFHEPNAALSDHLGVDLTTWGWS